MHKGFLVDSINFRLLILTINYVNADAVIPRKADTQTTNDIQLDPTESNASAIAVQGLKFASFAIPDMDPDIKQYSRVQELIVIIMLLGKS